MDAVGLAVAHESHQMARLKLYDVGMDMTIALRHHDHMPGLALVVRNAESSGVAGQALSRVGAEPVGEDPAAIAQHLNGLAAEGALLGEDRLIESPRFAAVGAFLAADDRCVLHIVLASLSVELCSIHGPHRVVRTVKQRGVLLAAGGVARDVHRRQPLGTILGQDRADDADVCAALISTGEPAAQQRAVGQLYHGRCLGGGIAAGGQQGFQRTHLFVFVDRAVPSQAGKFFICHSVLQKINRSIAVFKSNAFQTGIFAICSLRMLLVH